MTLLPIQIARSHSLPSRGSSLLWFFVLFLGCSAPGLGQDVVVSGQDASVSAQAPCTSSDRLTIVFSGDTLGCLDRSSKPSYAQLGGLARRVSLVSRLRVEDPDLLLVDGGNALFPEYLSSFDEGRTVVGLYNRMGYEVCGIGPFDLYLGNEALQGRAAQAKHSYVLSNAQGPFPKLCTVMRGKRRIVMASVVDPRVREMVPTVAALGLGDPLEAVRKAFSSGEAKGADLHVVLGAVPFATALSMLRNVEEIDLFLRLEDESERRPGDALFRVELARGAVMLTVPKRGTHLGRCVVTFSPEGRRVTRAELLPLGDAIPDDPLARSEIHRLLLRFESAYRDSLADLPPDLAKEFPRWVARILRRRLQAEVAILISGAFLERVDAGSFSLADLNRVMPFKDRSVLVHLTGAQLSGLWNKSAAQTQDRSRLIFAGMGMRNGILTINGQAVQSGHRYAVATVNYLASGGAGYFTAEAERRSELLKQLVIEDCLRQPQPILRRVTHWDRRPVHTFSTQLDTSLSRVFQNRHVTRYSDVPGLAVQEVTRIRQDLQMVYRRYAEGTRLTGTLDAKYEEVGETPSINQLWFELLHEGRQRRGGAPYLSARLDSTLTAVHPEGTRRPLKGQFSAGRSYKFNSDLSARFGLSAVKLYSIDDSPATFGLDSVFTYQKPIRSGLDYTGKLSYFASRSGRQIQSVDWENTFSLKLRERLAFTFKADMYLYRDSLVRHTAASNEIYFGLRYSLGRKWVAR